MKATKAMRNEQKRIAADAVARIVTRTFDETGEPSRKLLKKTAKDAAAAIAAGFKKINEGF